MKGDFFLFFFCCLFASAQCCCFGGLPSHGNGAVELVDLLLEELPQLRPLGLQRGRQQAVLDGEHLAVDVDVLHLVRDSRVENTFGRTQNVCAT